MYSRRDDLKKISLTYATSRTRQVISRQTARLKTDNHPNVNYLLRLMSTEPQRDARDFKTLRSKSTFPSPLIIDKTVNGHRDWRILHIIYEIIIYITFYYRKRRRTRREVFFSYTYDVDLLKLKDLSLPRSKKRKFGIVRTMRCRPIQNIRYEINDTIAHRSLLTDNDVEEATRSTITSMTADSCGCRRIVMIRRDIAGKPEINSNLFWNKHMGLADSRH